MTDYDDLRRAAAETNRALDAYVMSCVAGENTARLRGELNAAFRRQYDIDRGHSLGHETQDVAK